MMRIIKSGIIAVCVVFSSVGIVSAQQEIVNNLQAALQQQKGLQNYSISASSINGKLLLVGNVSTEKEKNIIIETAQSIPGVVSLREEIFVNPEYGRPVYSDEEIRNSIQEALASASLKVPGVTVKEGHVVLSGDYPSFRVVDEISSIILSTSGVQGFSTDVTINGRDYMDAFGGRTESKIPGKKKKCHGEKKEKSANGEKKPCCRAKKK
jgi:osmotically-inducible protein OsmY